jgi:hypothetical protein
VDLLVAPTDHGRAGALLTGLGFRDLMAGARDHERSPYADAFVRRADGAVIDLHRTLPAAAEAADAVWAALSGHTMTRCLATETVRVLDDTGLALHIALHAAVSGRSAAKPLDDLARALAAFDVPIMGRAATLATRIGALPAFVAGLALQPEGRALAAVLGLPTAVPAATAVRAMGGTRGTVSIAELLATPWWRWPSAVARRAFPSCTLLRRSMPLARRGRAGLVAAYSLRPFWLAARLPVAVVSWRAGKRAWAAQR